MEGHRDPLEARLIEDALVKAGAIFERDAIKLIDFVDLYGVEDVRRDESYVRECEKRFYKPKTPEEQEAKDLSKIFEAIIHEHGEQSDWFGPDATTIKTSKFDDYRNGVDSLIEFQNERKPASFLALAIDVTYRHNLDDKFNRLRREIQKGELTQIKYFSSEKTGKQKGKDGVPRIIIGANPSIIKSLTSMWLEGNNSALGKHPIQFQILDEAIIQCRAFAAYARKIDQPDVAARYENNLHILETVYNQKSKTLRDSGMRDNVCDAIRKITIEAASWK